MDNSPRALHLHHLQLQSPNLSALEQFYTEVVGLGVRDRKPYRDGTQSLVLTTGGLGLTDGGSPSGNPLGHFAFMAQSVDLLAQRAMDLGVPIVRGPGPGPFGHTLYLLDPDGNEVELIEEN